ARALFRHGRHARPGPLGTLAPLRARGTASLGVLATVTALLVGSVAIGGTSGDHAAGADPRANAPASGNGNLEKDFAAEAPPPQLPPATAAPAPAPPTLAAGPPLQSHEIFAFAPWWNLAEEQAFDVRDMTTLAYFSVDINPDGSPDQSSSGWVGYESQALVDLVNRAHAANDRVVLTVTCFDQHALDQLTSDPSVAGRLGPALVQLISAKNLDGVNFDFEGNGPRDRQGLDNLIANVANQLRAANSHWQITMSTYASSAGDPNGFYDIGGLNQSVDGFFVMAYDMNDPASPSPTAPLTGPGNNDNVDLAEYSDVVPRSKIILGVPYYGYDWPTAGPNQGDPATGAATPITFAQVAAQHVQEYWDRTSDTPWIAYQNGAQWHQAYFDDPTSLSLKARLANAYHVAGVGIWALGMDGNDPAMLAALLGHAAPAKYSSGPSVGAGGAAGSSQYSYSGFWNGTPETLTPVNPSTLPGNGEVRTAGQLQSFATNDPAATCLEGGKPLPVYELVAEPGTYVVQVTTPSYCANGTWEFSGPANPGTSSSTQPGGSSTTTSPGSTTTTTAPGLSLFGPTTTTTPANSTTTTKPSTTTTAANNGGLRL
ncbi:MAG TPA: glycosyl hydrolase family 18 protein, partial [Acidimicrobiales bacterium]|nr:glycosyl hydrolase family 18 protein [Acidimicrobiales bacterium]